MPRLHVGRPRLLLLIALLGEEGRLLLLLLLLGRDVGVVLELKHSRRVLRARFRRIKHLLGVGGVHLALVGLVRVVVAGREPEEEVVANLLQELKNKENIWHLCFVRKSMVRLTGCFPGLSKGLARLEELSETSWWCAACWWCPSC